jgi:hypothetical protein
MKMRRREHSHEATARGSGAFPNEAIRILILIVARQSRAYQREGHIRWAATARPDVRFFGAWLFARGPWRGTN